MAFRNVVLLAVLGTIAFGLPAHAASQAEQCNSLAAPLNKVRPTLEKFSQNGKDFEKEVQAASEKKDIVQLQSVLRKFAALTGSMSKDLSGLNTEISGVPLQDSTLIGVKNQYLQALDGFNHEIDIVTRALDTMGNSKLDTPQGQAEFQTAANSLVGSDQRVSGLAKQESATVDRFNAYCGLR